VPYQGTLKTPVSSPPPKTDKGRTHNHGQKPEAASKRVNGGESAEADLVEDKDADADVTEEIERQHNSFDHRESDNPGTATPPYCHRSGSILSFIFDVVWW
jgi:hypothetical protein